MSETPICLVTALPAEARPLRDHYGLRRDISVEQLDQAATQVIGRGLDLDVDALHMATHPAEIVSTRSSLGGASASRLNEMIKECQRLLLNKLNWYRPTQESP